ncbi:hypothetical protein H4R24_002704 [Coemansia sp. RSA 988]|nr:hypothetical protein H4R24_002704 [Coemansia sp. RSA 988]
MSEQPSTIDEFKVPAVPKRPPSQPQPPADVPPLNYEQPSNASTPQLNYSIEVIKDGSVVESHRVARDRAYFTFGRLPNCDFPMEHGSISRYHAVLQFYNDGTMAIVDLDSGHGTFVNRKPIGARTPNRVYIGDQIRFGASSRIWVIESSETELHEDVQSQKQTMLVSTEQNNTERQYKSHLKITKSYLSDPVRYLKRFMDKLGYEYDPYDITQDDDEDSEGFGLSSYSKRKQRHSGSANIRISLPYTDDDDNMLYGIGAADTRPEAERLACLNALKALDKHGYLESFVTSRKNANTKDARDGDENDGYYDNTNTGGVGNDDYLQLGKVETRESLLRKMALVTAHITETTQQLEQVPESAGKGENVDNAGDDELDAYMSTLAEDDQKARRKDLDNRLILLNTQKDKLESLVNIVAPDYSPLSPPTSDIQAKAIVPKLSIQERVPDSAKHSNVDVLNAPQSPDKPRALANGKRQAVLGPALEDSADTGTVKHARVEESTANNRVDTDQDAYWRPPTNQTGDGQTSLNEKYGY